jgi:hypothetical protein
MHEDVGRVLNAAGELTAGEAARLYAAAGLAVLPCRPGGKPPQTAHGLSDATTDLERIGEWWGRWPRANVAVATGGAGVDVLDVDRRPDGSGFPALDRLRSAGLVDGWVARVVTPSGGQHWYFPADPDRPQRSWALSRVHVDFRGTGGYVILPPSTVAGRPYGLAATNPTGGRPLDAAAVRRVLQPPRPQPAASAPLRREGARRTAHLVGWVASRPEGSRNAGLFWAACRYAEAGLDHAAAQEELGAAASQAGLAATEIAATIRSAYRNAHPQPGPTGHTRHRSPLRQQQGLVR